MQLRDRRQEAADFRQYMSALRERRALECSKERAALGVVTGQCRTVAAEWLRVGRFIGCHRLIAAANVAAAARYRRGDVLSSWEGATATAARKGVGQSPPSSARSGTGGGATAASPEQPAPAGDGRATPGAAEVVAVPLVPELTDQARHVAAAGAAVLSVAEALDACRTGSDGRDGAVPSRGRGLSVADGEAAAAAAAAQICALLDTHASLCSGANQAAVMGLADQVGARGRRRARSQRASNSGPPSAPPFPGGLERRAGKPRPPHAQAQAAARRLRPPR